MTNRKTMPESQQGDRRRQYEEGGRYTSHKSSHSLTTAQVAAHFSVTPSQVTDAIQFARAVDVISDNLGPAAKRLVLSGQPGLHAVTVKAISRTHPERQRFALAQVRAGRPPFAKPPAGGDPPFDTLGYAEVLSRKARTAGMLDAVADSLLFTPQSNWPDDRTAARLTADLKRIASACRSDSTAVRAAGGRASEGTPRTPWRERGESAPFDARAATWQVAAVRGVAEKNARELPRVIRETPPTPSEGRAVLDRNRVLAESAARFLAVLRAKGQDVRTGPTPVPGTYVTFFHLPRPAAQVRIGALGTFDFPAGVYAYLGSAFGGGGVRARTHRHLTTDTPKKWNIDWLKPLCTPAAVWWTHERRHVEFDWADLLADLPGASCPVVRFGGNDNPSADAHLVRFDAMPSIATFRRRVRTRLPGQAPIQETEVRNWDGRGWPV